MLQTSHHINPNSQAEFFSYWDELGFFDSIQSILPPQFFVMFDIARIMFTEQASGEALSAIDKITDEQIVIETNRDESIQVNRREKIAPVSDKMEIDTFKNLNELKKALPRELAQDDDIFDIRLFTKSLIVQKYYESESDSFKPISTSQNEKGKDARRFEQKCYVLLDRSKSMEYNMRDFYAKCILVEFLRRKMKSKAKIFYRSFDSGFGPLTKLENPADFSNLIEDILYTTTGGKSTNVELAVNQAISDINYDKDIMKSEIVLITDGISKINRVKLQEKLGTIKLHVIKIGHEMPEPDYFDMEERIKSENASVNLHQVNIKNVTSQLKDAKQGNEVHSLSLQERRVFQMIKDISESMFKDLQEAAATFIEIPDLQTDDLYTLKDENINFIQDSIARIENINIQELDIETKTRIYKKVYFLGQYVKMFLMHNPQNQQLQKFENSINQIKEQWLKDTELLFTFMQVDEFDDDKKIMKLSKKNLKAALKNLKDNNSKIKLKDLKNAQMQFSFDAGKGSAGKLFLILIVKLLLVVKAVLLLPFRPFRKKKV